MHLHTQQWNFTPKKTPHPARFPTTLSVSRTNLSQVSIQLLMGNLNSPDNHECFVKYSSFYLASSKIMDLNTHPHTHISKQQNYNFDPPCISTQISKIY